MSSLLVFEFTGEQLRNQLSTVSAGLSMALIVFAILTGQVGLYFWRQGTHARDPLWIKHAVILIWVMQVSELALACHMIVVVHSNDSMLPTRLVKQGLWEWAVYIATCATTECLVHAYFISRIYILEANQSHFISMTLCITLILEASFAFISMLFFATSGFGDSKHVVLLWSFPVWLGLSILIDISIAGSICYILKKGGPFISVRLNLMIKRLVKFCIQTGLITSLVTAITVVLWTVAELDPGHLLMSFPMGGIYATCFMANLVSRGSYLHHTQFDSDDEFFGTAMRSLAFASPEGSKEDESSSAEVN